MENNAITVSHDEEADRSFALALLLKGYVAYEVAHLLQKSLEWVEAVQFSLTGN